MTDAQQYKELMWTSGALLLQEQPFTLKSGRRSHVYANHRDLICVPGHLRLLAEVTLRVARDTFDTPFALATVDSSVSPFLAAACAVAGNIPFYNFRAVSREKGLSRQLFRYDSIVDVEHVAGQPAVIVDDVVTTMGTLLDARDTLEQHEVEVLGGVCLLDRRVASDIEGSPLRVAAASTLADMLGYGLERAGADADFARLVDVERMALAN